MSSRLEDAKRLSQQAWKTTKNLGRQVWQTSTAVAEPVIEWTIGTAFPATLDFLASHPRGIATTIITAAAPQAIGHDTILPTTVKTLGFPVAANLAAEVGLIYANFKLDHMPGLTELESRAYRLFIQAQTMAFALVAANTGTDAALHLMAPDRFTSPDLAPLAVSGLLLADEAMERVAGKYMAEGKTTAGYLGRTFWGVGTAAMAALVAARAIGTGDYAIPVFLGLGAATNLGQQLMEAPPLEDAIATNLRRNITSALAKDNIRVAKARNKIATGRVATEEKLPESDRRVQALRQAEGSRDELRSNQSHALKAPDPRDIVDDLNGDRGRVENYWRNTLIVGPAVIGAAVISGPRAVISFIAEKLSPDDQEPKPRVTKSAQPAASPQPEARPGPATNDPLPSREVVSAHLQFIAKTKGQTTAQKAADELNNYVGKAKELATGTGIMEILAKYSADTPKHEV